MLVKLCVVFVFDSSAPYTLRDMQREIGANSSFSANFVVKLIQESAFYCPLLFVIISPSISKKTVPC